MATVFFITPTCIPGSISKENCIGYCGCQGLFHSAFNYSFYRDKQKKVPLENGFAIARKQMMRPLNVGSGTELSREASHFNSTDELKLALRNSLQGLNRGVFGVRTTKKAELETLLKLLEGKNPLPNPTENLKMLLTGGWSVETSLQYNIHSWLQKNKVGSTRFYYSWRVYSDCRCRKGNSRE